MANYTRSHNVSTNPARLGMSEKEAIARLSSDLAGLIAAFNTDDDALTALTTDVTEIETAYELFKVAIPLTSFREMDANGVLAGDLGAQPTGILDLTTDITLTGVAYDSYLNGTTFQTEVLAAAANPTDTVLIGVTKALVGANSGQITITITPNDGTNNGATPVNLTTEQLVLAINGGVTAAYDGINCTITDAGGYLALITAAGGDATALANSGEGDSKPALMNGGRLPSRGIIGTHTTPSLGPVSGAGGDEMQALTWIAGNVDKVGAQVSLPIDFSGAANVTVGIRAKSGGDNDTPTIGVQTNWDNDDAPVADTSSAVNTDTADWAVETATIALADIPNAAGTVTIILTPGAHNTDTLQVAEVYLQVARAVTHA